MFLVIGFFLCVENLMFVNLYNLILCLSNVGKKSLLIETKHLT